MVSPFAIPLRMALSGAKRLRVKLREGRIPHALISPCQILRFAPSNNARQSIYFQWRLASRCS